MAVVMNEEKETPWYESVLKWLGNTGSSVIESNLNAKQARYEAELLAQQNQQNETLSFFGKELHKDTILWIAGGTLLAVLVLVIARR